MKAVIALGANLAASAMMSGLGTRLICKEDSDLLSFPGDGFSKR